MNSTARACAASLAALTILTGPVLTSGARLGDAVVMTKGIAIEGAAEQARTLPENATLLERQEVLFQMSEDVARALDKVLGEILRQHFAAHLVR